MEYVRDSLYLEEFVYSTPLPTLAFLTKETQQQLVAESIMARYVACSLYPNPSFRTHSISSLRNRPLEVMDTRKNAARMRWWKK